MENRVARVTEIIGASPKSFEDAIKQVVKEICSQKENVGGMKVKGLTVDIKDGKIVAYKANVKYAYLWEKKLSK